MRWLNSHATVTKVCPVAVTVVFSLRLRNFLFRKFCTLKKKTRKVIESGTKVVQQPLVVHVYWHNTTNAPIICYQTFNMLWKNIPLGCALWFVKPRSQICRKQLLWVAESMFQHVIDDRYRKRDATTRHAIIIAIPNTDF